MKAILPSCALALSVVFLLGCSGGDSKFSTAKVRGKVTFQGQPVEGAVVNFAPKSGTAKTGQQVGKGATGMTDKDGVYVLSTYNQGDGAVVGTHTVSVGSNDANKPLPGKSPPNLVVEVKPGSNDIPIELVK